MKLVFIGAGRLATQMAQAVCQAGNEVTAVYSRTMASAEALVSIVGGVADAVISRLLQELILNRSQEAFFHTAGSIPMSVFSTAGASRYGVIYPMQTFSKERKVDFSHIPIFIEANNAETLTLANAIATSLSNEVTQLSSDDRRCLHLKPTVCPSTRCSP